MVVTLPTCLQRSENVLGYSWNLNICPICALPAFHTRRANSTPLPFNFALCTTEADRQRELTVQCTVGRSCDLNFLCHRVSYVSCWNVFVTWHSDHGDHWNTMKHHKNWRRESLSGWPTKLCPIPGLPWLPWLASGNASVKTLPLSCRTWCVKWPWDFWGVTTHEKHTQRSMVYLGKWSANGLRKQW